MAEAIQMTNVRLSFPKLVEATAPPQSPPGTPKKFGADFLMEPSHPDYARFMAEVGKVASEKWKENGNAILQLIQGDRRLRCYGKGVEKVDKKTLKPYIGYETTVYVSGSSDEAHPPMMVDGSGNVVPNNNIMASLALARKLYGGCYVNVALRPWCQDNKFGRAIRCEIIAVQFAKDGEAFGDPAPDVTGMFGAVAAPAPAAAPKMPWEV